MTHSVSYENHIVELYLDYLQDDLTGPVNLKFKNTNSKPAQSGCFFVWDFEFWSLLFVCFLGFVI
jgi:hypothetical protein